MVRRSANMGYKGMARIAQQARRNIEQIKTKPMKNVLNESFFRDNPDKVLGEIREATDRYNKPIMVVKGSMDDIEAIDVPDVLVPSVDDKVFTSDINESVNTVLTNPEYEENLEKAAVKKEQEIARETVAPKRRRKKTAAGESNLPEIEQEMFSFDDILKEYNPGITEEEIEVWVNYQAQKGNELRGEWGRYRKNITEQWAGDMMGKGYLCYEPREGEYIPAPLYYSGNIAARISDILQNEKSFDRIPHGQRQRTAQMEKLENIKPKELTLIAADPSDRLIITPISAVAREFKIDRLADGTEYDEPKSLVRAFVKDYLYSIPDSDFELPVRPFDIEERYIQGVSDRSRRVSKEEKFEKKKNARIEGDRLFAKFLYEELTNEDKLKLQQYWNGRYNSWVDVEYDKIPIAFECGKTFKRGDLRVRPAQREGVAFNSVVGSGIIAYDVGVGKTMTEILFIAQALYSGACKRPVIVVPNPTYDKWIAEISGVRDGKGRLVGGGILPQYRVNDFKNLGVGYIEKLFDDKGNFIPIDEGTITVFTYEALYKIGFNEDTNKEFIANLMRILDDGSDSSKARDIAIKVEKAETTLGKVQAGTMIDFDDFDFDFICIDEAHNFKNIFTNVKGEESEGSRQYEIQGSVSTRGLKAFFITQYINIKHRGNVSLLTATPFTNNPLEVYSMLGLCAFPVLKDRGISSLREFFDTYVRQTYEVVYGSDFQFKERAVIKSWNNRISLQQLIFSLINYKSGEDAGIQRPNKIVLPLFRANIDGAIMELPEDEQISTFLAPTAEQRGYLKDIEAFVLKESTLMDIGSECNFDGVDEECSANDQFRTLTRLDEEEEDKGRALRGLSFSRAVTLSPFLYILNCACAEDKRKPNFYKRYVEESPKIFYAMLCIRSVKQWHEKRGEEVSGQILYMDAGKDNFKYLKEYLVKHVGYDPSQVQLITGGMSTDKKEKIKQGFLAGDVKIIIGTSTIKEGIDLQVKTSTLYNLWLDWRPTDVKQLEGRAWRFGNEFAHVRIVTPLIENSVDPFMFQKLEEKTARINDIFDRHGRKNVLDVEEFNPEELKVGLISDPHKRAAEEIRQETRAMEVDQAKLTSKIEGLNEILDVRRRLAYSEQKLMNQVEWKYDYLMRYYSPFIEEVEKEDPKTGEITTVEKKTDAREYLKDKLNISGPEDIKTVDQAIGFGKYYDRITKQSEFSYLIGDYRDNKKKLTNFEKSILSPRGLSLADDLDMVRGQLESEEKAIADKIKAMQDPENIFRREEQIRKEMEAIERKRKGIDGRVQDFARLNDKVLAEKMEYETRQMAKVKEHKDGKDKERKLKLARMRAKAMEMKLKLQEQELYLSA